MKGKIKQEIEDDWGFGESPPANGRIAGAFRGSKSRKKPRTRKRKLGERLSEENCEGFVKKELDAIEALVEFAQLPAKGAALQHTGDFIYAWTVKKRRSTSFKKSPSAEVGDSAEASAISLKYEKSGRVYLKDVLKAEAGKNASSESSKDSSFKDSRAESPNSPLPALQDGCLTNFKIIVPKVEEVFSLPTTLRRPSSLPTRTSKSLFLGSIKVEKDVDQAVIAKCLRALPSNAPKACRPSAGLKREITLQDSDSDSFKCKQSLEKGPSEMDAGCQNKGICLFETLKSEVKPEPSFGCASSDLRFSQKLGGRHSCKQKVIILSESEKEARRLRRIQANRESARQTIRRKQILCEELTKRANELVLMNENMKQERAILKQECQSLHESNCFLKQQVTTINIQENCKASSQPSADVIQPSSSPAMPFPFAPLIRLPYQAYPWLHSRKAGSVGCDPSQGEVAKCYSSETAYGSSYGESVALAFWLAMRTNMHMQMPLSSSAQLATVVHTPDPAKLGSSFLSVPEGVVEDSLASGRVENSTTVNHCFQEIGNLELVHVENNSQEQKIEPDSSPQCPNSVSPVNDVEAANASVQSSEPQNGINWHLTESLPWDRFSQCFPIKPLGRQSQHSLTFEMQKQYPTIERKDLDLLLKVQQQQMPSFFVSRDGAAAKAAEARRRRKQITRKKSLLRLRSSKC
ncbi:hypothetical protein O6H91_01G009700 [Diphasiastrum complanatum]|uniref:Uncharacterized protein n=1 Tax=Diphasiastrum complanatum TaxID=34168 RepID=A0ACC2EN31_DIPCM|nr:hypothetical protein O6H91_01G009700 [Diphasiastrum complanatum]